MTTTISRTEWASMGYEKANQILSSIPLIERLEVLQDVPSTHVPFEHWIRVSKAELMQWYMNALVTSSCIGHSKSERNMESANQYLELMNKYNVPVPSNDVCYILGVFNGDGSY